MSTRVSKYVRIIQNRVTLLVNKEEIFIILLVEVRRKLVVWCGNQKVKKMKATKVQKVGRERQQTKQHNNKHSEIINFIVE